ncbi:unnamed protein product [Penicillium olsonii]|uniref:Dynein light chain n=1 Tax=Penicillium olsonii TaxID=99116 RepID=A0A9W4N7C4_PENOL|nr:unnamed protein product [Penicillium olsonii]CAG7921436.1 unnamed protein product [Penicillium olsonii]CAG7983756.1 unnamed protein product [Penicillium olsonii]CAG8278527.1 unnamed protein product [Penicillium olsonii]
MANLPASDSKEKMEAQVKPRICNKKPLLLVRTPRGGICQQRKLTHPSAIEAMDKFRVEKDIAQYIKKEFDSRKGATWHCVVGRNFGSFVTHETKHFIYFYLGHCAILLFKTQ